MANEAWKDKLRGNYNVVKGKLKQSYSSLTDDDLTYQEGKEDEWLGRVQRKTGKTKQEIKDTIDRI